MSIEFRCTHCQKLLRTLDNTAGKHAKCPECGTRMTIPMPGTASPPSAGPSPAAHGPSGPASPFAEPQHVQRETGNPYQSPQVYGADDIHTYQWYFSVGGQQYGPVTTAALVGQIRSGVLGANVNVWRTGIPQWRPAHLVPELQAAGLGGFFPEIAPNMHRLSAFPVPLVILLHFVSLGLFTTIWLNLMHGQLPRNRPDDPSAGKAIGFLFIPFFNLYWVFFTYCRLCDRINEQRIMCGLSPSMTKGLAIAMCVLMVIPYIGVLSFLFLVPIFAGVIQASTNELVATTYRGATPFSPHDTRAVASLTLGILGMLAWFCPGVGLVISGVGLGLGLKSMNSVSRGMAIAGVCLSGISLLLALIVNAMMIFGMIFG